VERPPNIDIERTVMSQGSQTQNVGARLREAREKRGVTLREIANSTRIGVMSLEALERSDLSRLPGGIFTRAFIRAYAQEVGLDPERMIQDFIAELPPESPAATAAHPVAMEDGEALESDRKAVATAMKLILVSVPIAGFVIWYGMTHRTREEPAPAPAAVVADTADTTANAPTPAVSLPVPAPVPAEGTPASSPLPAPAPVPAPAPATVPAPTGLSMEIAPKGDCWVSATVDGEQVFSGLMHAGDKRQIAAHEEISLNVGDAGAFAYTLNGKPGRALGAPGEVVSKRITLAEAKDYTTP
jgi:cytoskeleton protein RodZ